MRAKRISWSSEKATALRNYTLRGNVGLEECVIAIEQGRILADIENPSPLFSHQRMLVLRIKDYAHVGPYIENNREISLKTVIPSRKLTAIYLTGTKA